MKKEAHKKISDFLKNGSLVFLFSFFFNFFWESIHAVLFYEHHNEYTSAFFVSMVTYSSLVDAFLIFLIFSCGCLLFGRKCWLQHYKLKEALFTISLGIIIAFFIEVKALLFGQWKYNKLMPTLFGIGLSPLAQLAITGTLTLILVSRLKYP